VECFLPHEAIARGERERSGDERAAASSRSGVHHFFFSAVMVDWAP
jgi:hypothetical protein